MKKLIFITTIGIGLLLACNNPNTNTTSNNNSTAQLSTVKEVSKQLELDPTNADLYYQRANIYTGANEFELALADVNDAIVLDSTQPVYHFLQGKILYSLNKTIAAANAYEKAIAIKPDFEDAKIKLAELYYLVKEHKKANNLLNQVVVANQANAQAWFLKGMNLKETGDTASAINAFQKAFDIDGSYYDAAMQLGLMYAAIKNKIALNYYVAASRLSPKNAEPPYNAGVFLQQIGQQKKAIKMYEQALRADPSFYLAYYNAGMIAVMNAEYKDAIDNFSQVIRIETNYADAYYMRGLCYQQLKDAENAELNFNYAIELNPKNTLYQSALKKLK